MRDWQTAAKKSDSSALESGDDSSFLETGDESSFLESAALHTGTHDEEHALSSS